jgi:hypothetical protein
MPSEPISYELGYISSLPRNAQGNFILDGRNVVYEGVNIPVPFDGLALVSGVGSSVTFAVTGGYVGLGTRGADGKGSVIPFVGDSIIVVGTGQVYFNGAKVTNVVTDAAITSGAAILTSAKGRFRAADVGAAITVSGAGVAGATLTTTILTYTSATQVTLASNASTTVTNATATWDFQAGTQATLKLRVSNAFNAESSGPFLLGLTEPDTPTLALQAGGTKMEALTRSAKVTRIRTATGAESNASPQSVTVTPTTTDKLRVTLANDVESGSDAWGYYFTRGGFGSSGNHYFYDQLLDSALSGSAPNKYYDFEFRDGDLLPDLAPKTNDRPPTAVFGFALQTALGLVGCWNTSNTVTATSPGNMLAGSYPDAFESFPARNLAALPEAPTAVLPRQAGGYVYLSCSTSLHRVSFTGASFPFDIVTQWPGLGFKYQKNVCLTEDGLYGFIEGRGPVRMDADGYPDFKFADRIAKSFKSSSASNVVVGYDPRNQHVFYSDSAGIKLSYDKGRDIWTAPLSFANLTSPVSGTIVGAFEYDNRLRLVIDDSSSYKIYTYNSGSGSNWYVTSSWRTGGFPGKNKRIEGVQPTYYEATNSSTVTISVLTNMDGRQFGSISQTYTIPSAGAYALSTTKGNIREAKFFAVEFAGSGSNDNPVEAVVFFEPQGVTT